MSCFLVDGQPDHHFFSHAPLNLYFFLNLILKLNSNDVEFLTQKVVVTQYSYVGEILTRFSEYEQMRLTVTVIFKS